MSCLYADIDTGKPGACRDIEHAHEVIDTLSELLDNTRPAALIFSGKGLLSRSGPCSTATTRRTAPRY